MGIRVVYQDSGIGGIALTRFDLFQLPIVGFETGSSAGFTATSQETRVRGRLTFTGGSQHIRTKVSNNDHDLLITCVIPEDQTDIEVGNVVLYTERRGERVPAAMIVLDEVVWKRNAQPDAATRVNFGYPGNRLAITLAIRLVEISEDVTVQIFEPDFSSLPIFPDLRGVPDPINNPFPHFVVNRLGDRDQAALVSKGENEQYWADPLWQNVNSPKYGIINHLEGDRVTWFWGGPYTLTDADYARVAGGLTYNAGNDGEVFGGLSYTE